MGVSLNTLVSCNTWILSIFCNGNGSKYDARKKFCLQHTYDHPLPFCCTPSCLSYCSMRCEALPCLRNKSWSQPRVPNQRMTELQLRGNLMKERTRKDQYQGQIQVELNVKRSHAQSCHC